VVALNGGGEALTPALPVASIKIAVCFSCRPATRNARRLGTALQCWSAALHSCTPDALHFGIREARESAPLAATLMLPCGLAFTDQAIS